MEELGFDPKLVPLLLNRTKTVTWRLFGHHNNIKKGDIVRFLNSSTGDEIAKAKIVNIIDKTMGMLTENDMESHEKFYSKNEMYAYFEELYNKKVEDDTPVRIIKFELLS